MESKGILMAVLMTNSFELLYTVWVEELDSNLLIVICFRHGDSWNEERAVDLIDEQLDYSPLWNKERAYTVFVGLSPMKT